MGETPDRIAVSVAVIEDADRRILWTWNEAWGVFALPMTAQRAGSGLVELPRHAAARAATEALGVPVRIAGRWMAIPELRASGRDLAVRMYAYDVFRAEPHPRYAGSVAVRGPHVWLTPEEALSGEYQPLSQPSLEILTRAVVQGQLPGRIQHTSVLIIRRGHADDRRFLLRREEHWGYALPAGRRAPGRSALDVANDVARDELGLTPGRDVAIAPARTEALTLRGPSPETGIPTYYVHALFEATLGPAAHLASREPLVWASPDEILRGETDAREAVPGTSAEAGPALPGPISPTVFRVLAATDDSPWIDTSLALP